MTIFPELINSFIGQSIIKRSEEKNLVKYDVKNIRDFADPPHYKTDDYPFGGGNGMIFKPEPIFRTYDDIMNNVSRKENVRVVFPTPDGDDNITMIFLSLVISIFFVEINLLCSQ